MCGVYGTVPLLVRLSVRASCGVCAESDPYAACEAPRSAELGLMPIKWHIR